MPRRDDRGIVARAVLYFFTMYDGIDIATVGSVDTFKKWNLAYLPAAWERGRNDRLNKTQGNRNPYIDDPSLANEVF
jgi:endonuclease I